MLYRELVNLRRVGKKGVLKEQGRNTIKVAIGQIKFGWIKGKCLGNAINVLTFKITDLHSPQQYKEQIQEQRVNENNKEKSAELLKEVYLSDTPYIHVSSTLSILIFCKQMFQQLTGVLFSLCTQQICPFKLDYYV